VKKFNERYFSRDVRIASPTRTPTESRKVDADILCFAAVGRIVTGRTRHAHGGGRRPRLTHVDGRTGRARMVDVSGKRDTRRTATAVARVRLDRTATRLIAEDACGKGDVLAVAQLAGTQAAKIAWQLIPLCHHVRLDAVTVDATLDERRGLVRIVATAVSTDRTGVEMECLTACALAALTVYDMCKAVSRHTVIERVRLLSKTGGATEYACDDDDDDYPTDN